MITLMQYTKRDKSFVTTASSTSEENTKKSNAMTPQFFFISESFRLSSFYGCLENSYLGIFFLTLGSKNIQSSRSITHAKLLTDHFQLGFVV